MSRAIRESIARKLHAYAAGDPQPNTEVARPSTAEHKSTPDPATGRARERRDIREAITRKLVEHAERFYVDRNGRQHELMPRAPQPEEEPPPEPAPSPQGRAPIDQGARGTPVYDERAASYRAHLEERNRQAKVNGWDLIDVDRMMRRFYAGYYDDQPTIT